MDFKTLSKAVSTSLDVDDYNITLGEKLGNGIQQIILTDTKDRSFCYNCLENSCNKKEASERKVLDVLEKQPVQYIIKRHRYKCRFCGATFTPDDIFPAKIHATSRYEDFVAQKILEDDSLSLKLASKMYGVSQTYASNAIHKYEQRFEARLFSIKPCHTVVFYPFEYGKRIRCCVIGTDFSEKEALLGILPDYAESTLLQFIREKIEDINGLKTIFCDLYAKVFRTLSDAFPDKRVFVITEQMAYHCKLLKRDNGDGCYNQKHSHVNQFLSIIKDNYSDHESFVSAVRHWRDTTPVEVKHHFDRFWEQLEQCMAGCMPGTSYGDLRAATALMYDIIKGFRKKNTSFDILVLKTWFLEDERARQIKKTKFGIYMRMAYVSDYDGNLYDYGVDIGLLHVIYLLFQNECNAREVELSKWLKYVFLISGQMN